MYQCSSYCFNCINIFPLEDSKFDGADFTNGIVDRASFSGSSLKGAIFSNTVLTGTSFQDANVENADFSDACESKWFFFSCPDYNNLVLFISFPNSQILVISISEIYVRILLSKAKIPQLAQIQNSLQVVSARSSIKCMKFIKATHDTLYSGF